ncbi:hypothetical protein TNCV_1954061 [Trichonephila clavipes]|nr:hypothetical protein TNCV_1954061 [Trichonephila clavipes]
MFPVLGKKAVLEWCMKEGLIGSSCVCPKCGKSMELRERTGRIEILVIGLLNSPVFVLILTVLTLPSEP